MFKRSIKEDVLHGGPFHRNLSTFFLLLKKKVVHVPTELHIDTYKLLPKTKTWENPSFAGPSRRTPLFVQVQVMMEKQVSGQDKLHGTARL